MTRIVVCGSNYGAYYVVALRRSPAVGTLAAILGRGSRRSYRLAERHGVPLCRRVGDLPSDVEVACVAIGAGGESVVDQLLRRGIHVLCEHPIGSDRVLEMHRLAEKSRVRCHVNAHFPDLPQIREFVEHWRRTSSESEPLHVGVACSDRALYAATAIVAEATAEQGAMWRIAAFHPGRPYGTLLGDLDGSGLSIEVQRSDGPDGLADGSPEILVDFSIRVIFSTGVLSLLSPAGPVVWCANGNRVTDGDDPLAEIHGGSKKMTARHLYIQRIEANRQSIRALVGDAATGTVPTNQTVEHLLRVSRMWEAVSRAIAGTSV